MFKTFHKLLYSAFVFCGAAMADPARDYYKSHDDSSESRIISLSPTATTVVKVGSESSSLVDSMQIYLPSGYSFKRFLSEFYSFGGNQTCTTNIKSPAKSNEKVTYHVRQVGHSGAKVRLVTSQMSKAYRMMSVDQWYSSDMPGVTKDRYWSLIGTMLNLEGDIFARTPVAKLPFVFSNHPLAASRFTPELYALANQDLQIAVSQLPAHEDPHLWLANHYQNSGIKEGRFPNGVPDDFDALAYGLQHPDLARAVRGMGFRQAETWLRRHYIVSGKTEGRSHGHYDPDLYLAMYPDISDALGTSSGVKLYTHVFSHYIKYGIDEDGRVAPVLPVGFSPLQYKAKYSDLADMTDLEAGVHWLLHGEGEGRSFG